MGLYLWRLFLFIYFFFQTCHLWSALNFANILAAVAAAIVYLTIYYVPFYITLIVFAAATNRRVQTNQIIKNYVVNFLENVLSQSTSRRIIFLLGIS